MTAVGEYLFGIDVGLRAACIDQECATPQLIQMNPLHLAIRRGRKGNRRGNP